MHGAPARRTASSSANFHVTGGACADEQFRARRRLRREPRASAAILAGDANLRPGDGRRTICCAARASREPLPGSIDQIFVRGLPSTPPVAWPEERRRVDGRLLSDHAPVELTRRMTLRGGTRAVPGARALRVSERGHERAARARDGRRARRAGAPRPRATAGAASRTSSGCSSCARRRGAGFAACSASTRCTSRSSSRRRAAARPCSPGSASTGEDEVITTDQEHFGLTGPLYATRRARRRSSMPTRTRSSRAITPRTRLIATSHVLWTTGRRLDLHRVKRGERAAAARRRRAVRRRDPGRRRRARLLHGVRAEVALRAGSGGRALRARPGARARQAPSILLAGRRTSCPARSSPKESAARFDAGWIGVPTLVGLVAALGTHPEWRYERAAEMAARCRELLEPHVEVVTPPGHSTLVSFRPPGDPDRARRAARTSRA